MVNVFNDHSGYTVEVTPKKMDGEILIIGIGFTMNIPPDTPVKLSSKCFYLKYDQESDHHSLHWDWFLRMDQTKQGNGNGNCWITEADFLELRKHFKVLP